MTEKKIPTVRIGEQRVPAHRLWNVVESINTAADLVERFNDLRPELTTPMTRDVVAKVRARIRDMDLELGGDGALRAAAEAAGIDVGEPEQDKATEQGSTELTGTAKQGLKVPEDELAEAARQLLDAMSVEEALAMLKADYDDQIGIRGLIELVGAEAYVGALEREAGEYAANMIAPDQIAELWNESGYLPPAGGLWTRATVEKLLP